MPRARQPRVKPPSRAGKRDYAAEYAYRVRKARTAEQRREARGHAGQVRAFLRDVVDGSIVNVDRDEAINGFDGKTFKVITKWIIDGRKGSSGKSYVFRRMSLTRFRRLIREELERGARLAPYPSLNQRAVLAGVEADE